MQCLDLTPDLVGQIRVDCHAVDRSVLSESPPLTFALSMRVSADTVIVVPRVHGRLMLRHACALLATNVQPQSKSGIHYGN
jgi:hypothetical protein